MSLVDSSHLVPASRGRHGAHYKLIKRAGDNQMVPGMILFRDTVANPIKRDEPMCQNCFRTPFSPETKVCPKCGGRIE